jgi:hypothetical protein
VLSALTSAMTFRSRETVSTKDLASTPISSRRLPRPASTETPRSPPRGDRRRGSGPGSGG